MTFDISKVYTMLNAEDVKIGSKGYFADNVKTLKEAVLAEDSVMFGEVEEIFDDSASRRFGIKDESGCGFGLFYPVNKPESKKFRPYTNVNEMVDDFKERSHHVSDNKDQNLSIYVKSKDNAMMFLVTCFGDGYIRIGLCTTTFANLFKNYTYLDGSPCGYLED